MLVWLFHDANLAPGDQGATMAKTRKKTKTKKPGKAAKTAKKARPSAKQKFKAAPRRRGIAQGAMPTLARAAVADPNALSAAVIHAVRATLDIDQPNWNSDGNGNQKTMSSFGYSTMSVRTFITAVAQYLKPTYKIDINGMSMSDCVAANVVGLESLIIDKTALA
jgi:hypothetical protein